MNEYRVQNVIARLAQARNHEWAIPNTYLYGWESDFLSLTRAGLVHEYEIKVTVADFRKELKQWHDGSLWLNCKRHRYLQLNQKKYDGHCPNYFWFAFPEGLVDISDVPECAGVVAVHEDQDIWKQFTIKREAPRLHRGKITKNQKDKVIRGLSVRYWDMRWRRESDRVVKGEVAA